MPNTKREIKMRFMEATNFPGVVGAIDGTHVAMMKSVEQEHSEFLHLVVKYGHFLLKVKLCFLNTTMELKLSLKDGERNKHIKKRFGYSRRLV